MFLPEYFIDNTEAVEPFGEIAVGYFSGEGVTANLELAHEPESRKE
jgi:hypothetical protein